MTAKTTNTMKTLGTADAIKKAIASIKTRGAKLDKDIQICAVSAIEHHSKCFDVSLINQLIQAMPKGSRVNALKAFIDTFGAVKYDEETKTFINCKSKPTDLEGAVASNWTEFKPEKPYQGFDLDAEVTKLIAKAEKAQEDKENQSKVKVNPSHLKALKTLVKVA